MRYSMLAGQVRDRELSAQGQESVAGPMARSTTTGWKKEHKLAALVAIWMN